MPRGKYLNEIEKGKILALLGNGLSYREIGRQMRRSDKVIGNFRKNQSKYGKKTTGGLKKSYQKETVAVLLTLLAIL